MFLDKVPENLATYYPTAYYTLPESKERLEHFARKESFKLDLIRPYRPSGRLLEIGPAWGSFAFAAKSAGYDVSTVEIDERCCQYLRDVVGVAVHKPDQTGALPDGLGQYDVVALWHVLEHLPRFEQVLTRLAGLLLAGGIIAIASPNPDAWQFRLMRRHWPHVDAPRHLQLIPLQVIREILSASGFEVLLSTCNDRGGLGWNRFGWQRLIMNSLPASRAATAVGLAAGAALGEILSPLDRRQLQGATYTVILKKRSPQ